MFVKFKHLLLNRLGIKVKTFGLCNGCLKSNVLIKDLKHTKCQVCI